MSWFMKMINKQKYQHRRKKLVEALRSGDYSQISGGLHDDQGYCCLGVACEVSGLGDWVDMEDEEDGPLNYFKYLGDNSYLPSEVRKYYGWSTDQGRLTFVTLAGHVETLATLNDYGFSFDEIADIINAGLVEEAA